MATTPTISTGEQKAGQIIPGASSPSNQKSIFDSGTYVQQHYNELLHDVDLYLDNSGNFENPSRYYINPAAVLGLHINDTCNDWVVNGYLTFLYMPEGIPGSKLDDTNAGSAASTPTTGPKEKQEKAAAEVGKVLQNYLFRGDGYDLLRVMIMPKSTAIPGSSNPGLEITSKDTKWMLSYLFSVYDVEDVKDIPQLKGEASSYLKCLKLKFHDVRYQMLLTTNLEYSSAEPKNKKDYTANFFSEVAAGQGVLHTGDMLRDIMNEAIANPELGGCKEFEIPKDEHWDKGAAELFYTSPAQWSAADDVDYVFSHHVSEEELKGGFENKANDMCLLHTDRSDTFGGLEKIRLTPLSKIFEKAGNNSGKPGDLQKEHFFVTSTTENESVINLHRAPMGGDGKNVDLKTTKYGQILSYSFLDMSPAINSNMFCSKPVYSVDIGDRMFNMEFENNDVISARRMISQSYITHLFKEGSDNEKLFLPTIHKNKKDLNVFPTFSLNGNNAKVRQRNGLHDLIYTGVFQNACICFKVLGLTFRESGTFIGIDRTDGCLDTDYNNKLYGQWFVVQVDHIFEAGAYVNLIYAVKVHRHKQQSEEFKEGI